MTISTVFHELAAILVIAGVIGVLALKLRQPLIISYIVTGIVAGPAVLGWGGPVQGRGELTVGRLECQGGLRQDSPGRPPPGREDGVHPPAVLGPRPIELLHLSVRIDPHSGEAYWWCGYQKRRGNGAGDPFGTDLNRQQAWMELREQMAVEQRRLVPYSFRHAYSLRGHRRGIDAGLEPWPTAWGIPWRCTAGAAAAVGPGGGGGGGRQSPCEQRPEKA